MLIGFEDGVLSIQGAGKMIVLPAEGMSWPRQVTIPAANLRRLPKRLMREQISVSVWDLCLWIDRYSYVGVVDVTPRQSSQDRSG